MSEFGSAFIGSVPQYYERGLVPNIFEDFSGDISARAAALAPTLLLELASGTGVVSCDLRRKLPDSSLMICSDLNAPMLELAKQKLVSSKNVEFKIVDAMDLPFADNTLDLILCQFGVMFFPDRVASYKEARRALKPEGTYLFNTWNKLEENPFASITNRLAHEMFPNDPPQFYLVPFHYHDPAEIEDEVRQAGFTSVTIELRNVEKIIKSLDEFVEGLVFGNPLAKEIRDCGSNPEEFQKQLRMKFVTTFGENPSVMSLSAWFVAASG